MAKTTTREISKWFNNSARVDRIFVVVNILEKRKVHVRMGEKVIFHENLFLEGELDLKVIKIKLHGFRNE